MLPPDFWINEKNRLLAILRPRLAQMAYEGAKQASFKAGIEFNPVLANAQAVEYARTHTDALLNQLGTTSQNLVGQALADWIDKPGATIGDLQAALKPSFGQARASVIAATETTRAYASGEMAAYQAEGYTEWTWLTNNDELVCPICGALHHKSVRIGQPFGEFRGKAVTQPPAHPNCRCTVRAVVGKKSQVDKVQFASQDTAAVAEQLPLPQALGADVVKRAQLQIQRNNELANLNQQQLQETIQALRTPNPIPKIEYHFEKHFEGLNVNTIDAYQNVLDNHLQNPDLRFFTGIKDDNSRVWFIVDTGNSIVSEYNESNQQHYTVYRSEDVNSFLNHVGNWLIEVDERQAKARMTWQP